MSALMDPYVRPPGYRRALLFSAAGHVLLLVFFLLVNAWRPAGQPLSSGALPGGGSGGSFLTVDLSPALSGGAGMYKPALISQPAVAPPKLEKQVVPPPSQEVFQEKSPPRKVSEPTAGDTDAATPGAIPRKPEPGSGGRGGLSGGAGGGLGNGQGVTIGPGTGQGTIESWYVRQVEQRVGQNWLRTSLGELSRSVQTVISFHIQSDGTIAEVRVEEASGIRAVDLAAERAVRASGPLPPLPREFRGRSLNFMAYFEYPPK